MPSPTPSSDSSDGTGVALPDGLKCPLIVSGGRTTEPELVDGEISRSPTAHKRVLEKYFIIKSLTVEDVELIFSANKSGEYFGYARMSSTISGEPVNLGALAGTEEAKISGMPQCIPTPATKTASRGHIFDDFARGTIFWEADSSETEPESPVKDGSGLGSGHHWRHQFKIEWVSTVHLPFFRTRGLRNPWNANGEVKIARDGTEFEPSVGRTLVAMFYRPLTAVQGGVMVMPPTSMPYR
ncbi:hypothetical protein LTR48_004207 [Friedmanniomyces endolithicus]|uniref:YTH domain-containing protein n=1 Tax=Rachicladosporium monterosium TaxID=1507873 RepID=A0ABR0LEW9_9PEZI|nr:hypothetical protein LTR48_004207 [Friedmanniomyces endolithicus]KAK5147776.1 hypothetical protein LTR32_000835 [Rachicladosporium monterosium]